MEYITTNKIKIKNILIHNGNWWKFFIKYHSQIRKSIIINIAKILICRTCFLGFHSLLCSKCNFIRKIPHTCKSRLCSSCGKKTRISGLILKLKLFLIVSGNILLLLLIPDYGSCFGITDTS